MGGRGAVPHGWTDAAMYPLRMRLCARYGCGYVPVTDAVMCPLRMRLCARYGRGYVPVTDAAMCPLRIGTVPQSALLSRRVILPSRTAVT
jgi:hypothetical protein